MPTTRTILMMLLNRYSEPPGSSEHAGTIVEGVVLLRNHTAPAPGHEDQRSYTSPLLETQGIFRVSFGAHVRS
jgi:hypothetical protein